MRLATIVAGLACLGGMPACVERGDGFRRREVPASYVNDNLLPAIPFELDARLDVSLDGVVRYLGYKADANDMVPGGTLTVYHYWQVLAAPGPSWRVFTHLRGDAGTTDFVNADESDMRFAYPPSQWKPGQIIQDIQQLALPPGWQSAQVSMEVGLIRRGAHRPVDRMPVAGSPTQVRDGAIVAATFPVDRSKAPPPPGTVVVRPATSAILIDGVANEAAWGPHAAAAEFVTADGSPEPPGGTRGKLTWDDAYLYVFVAATDKDVWSDFKVEDEPLWKQDVIEVFIDADGNRRGYVELQVNPHNVHFSSWFAGARGAKGDEAWDAPMVSAVKVRGTADNRDDVDQGWDLELAIPWAAVKGADAAMNVTLPPREGQTVKLNVVRVDYANGAKNPTVASWNKITYQDFHGIDRLLTMRMGAPLGPAAPVPPITPAAPIAPAR